jgi:hypothetical protein
MNVLVEYRGRLMERLEQAAREFCSACEGNAASMSVGGDWSLHQVAAHVRDMDRAVYGARVRRTLQEENPLFQSLDPDDWMAAHYNKDEPLPRILNEFKTDVDDLCRALKETPGEAWSRVSRHETIGEGLTLQFWVEHGLAHIEEHLNAVRKLS